MVKVRFAPSPTGYLHIGGARTCLFSWLFARKQKGQFVLRIEDTDQDRSKKEYLDEIVESIAWLGMNWDEMLYQSQRFDLYAEYAQKLIDAGCAQKKEGAVFFTYDFDKVEIDDLIRGTITFTELPKDEEVIIKSDGSPTYNFCCVVDDALMKITHVIRGEDHISNTPKQILLYQALGFDVPVFAHVPLILSPEGGRMSKRYGATSIREYRQSGYLPEALVNYLLLLGWSPGQDREIISLHEATELFDIARVNKTGAAFSIEKLNWVNGQYIRAVPLEKLTALIQESLTAQDIPAGRSTFTYLQSVVKLFQERLATLDEFVEKSSCFFTDEFPYQEATRPVIENKMVSAVEGMRDALGGIDSFDAQTIEATFRETLQQLGLKMKQLVHPVRVALTGSRHGPGLFETMEVLGKEKVLQRLNRLIRYWQEVSQ